MSERPTLEARTMPCGCILCVCDTDGDRCLGCGCEESLGCNQSRQSGGPRHVLSDGTDAAQEIALWRAQFTREYPELVAGRAQMATVPVDKLRIVLRAALGGEDALAECQEAAEELARYCPLDEEVREIE